MADLAIKRGDVNSTAGRPVMTEAGTGSGV